MNLDNADTYPLDIATAGAADVKACCAAAYQSDLVAIVLGPSFHPGGLALTRHLARHLGLTPGRRVLDLANGPGATALMLCREFGVTVVGVDLGEATVATATQAARDAGSAGSVSFGIGDAERLPFPNGSFDAVVCECAFSTFRDKPRAAAELARVLRPGGRVGINDVTVETDQLRPELRTLAAWVACLADAQPLDTYAAILAEAGLTITCTERHDSALAVAIDAIHQQLRTLQLLARTTSALAQVNFDRALNMTALANHALDDGIAGYGLLIAEKPAQNTAELGETYR